MLSLATRTRKEPLNGSPVRIRPEYLEGTNPEKSGRSATISRTKRLFSILLLALLIIVSTGGLVPGVNATDSNLLYINPPQQGPVATGARVIYEVKVANMDPF